MVIRGQRFDSFLILFRFEHALTITCSVHSRQQSIMNTNLLRYFSSEYISVFISCKIKINISWAI